MHVNRGTRKRHFYGRLNAQGIATPTNDNNTLLRRRSSANVPLQPPEFCSTYDAAGNGNDINKITKYFVPKYLKFVTNLEGIERNSHYFVLRTGCVLTTSECSSFAP